MVKDQQTNAVGQMEKNLYDLNDVYRKQGEYIKRNFKVSALEMEILQFVLLEGKKKMKEIGEHFNIKLSTLTSIIDKIERQKLVKRVNSKEDRRVVYLEASRKGEKLYDSYNEYLHSQSKKLKKDLGSDYFEAVIQGLKQMYEVSAS